MGVLAFQEETTSPVAPARLYKALLDSYNIIPKVIESFKITVEIVEGNGGPGTIKKITYIEDGEAKDSLHKIEAIDDANLGYTYSLIGGVRLPDTAEKITYETKLFAGPNGGSTVNFNVKFETKGDAKPNEEEIKTLKAKDEALFKAVEAYLLANPDYN